MQPLPGELLTGSSTLGCRCFAEGQFPVQQETGKSLTPWRPRSVPKGSFPVLRAIQHWIHVNQNQINSKQIETHCSKAKNDGCEYLGYRKLYLMLKQFHERPRCFRIREYLPLDCSVLWFQKNTSLISHAWVFSILHLLPHTCT